MENGETDSVRQEPSEPGTHCSSGSELVVGYTVTDQSRSGLRDVSDTVIRFSKGAGIRDSSFIDTNFKEIDNLDELDRGNSSRDTSRDSAHDSDYFTNLSSQSPETRDLNARCFDDKIGANGDVVQTKTREIRANGIESSAESYTERILRSGTWPLAEGSCRLHVSISNDDSKENSRKTRAGQENSESKANSDDNDETIEEDKGFSLRTLTRDQIVILIATSFTNLLSFLSLSILAPFFPIEADKKDVNSTISGWIFGVFALVQFLTSPLFGRLLPVVGCRFMYIAGLFMCGGCTLLFGILDRVDTSDSIVLFVSLCFVTRVLLALGCTGLSNAGFVMLVRHFPDSVATVFGIGEVFTGIGMVAGPAVGGFLYAAGGFILPFAVIGGCSFIALPLIWYFIPIQNDVNEDTNDDLSIRKMLIYPRTIVNSIVVIIAASVWSVLDPTLEPHLRVYGLGPELVGVLFLIMAAFYSVTSPIWGRVADKLPDNRFLLVPGMLVCAAGLLLVGPSPVLGFEISFNELWLTILSLVVLGVGSSMAVIPTYDVYIDILGEIGYPEDTRTYGMVSGLWVSMYALGDFAGPSLGGFLFDTIGFEWLTTWIAAACVFTGILICVTWFIEKKCCQKTRQQTSVARVHNDVTEKTPLLASVPETDVLNTYPPGSTYSSSYSAV
ncbi:MFS-type transporter SLC18B1-like [Mercenaria mercenaria]|uniref:MFS-type transporter SLC18B1-like n=1 Tax=Mercenaria mercenaria TaxID=6596 RepID=UPI00234F08FE|nr:MFS-type transporter SLC18B1-like [Mercenaria mercenaria]